MDRAAHRWVDALQLMVLETLLRTFEILSPTVRMDAIAATAISEAINVYSTAVAPRLSLINWRKMDSILISKTSNRATVRQPTSYEVASRIVLNADSWVN